MHARLVRRGGAAALLVLLFLSSGPPSSADVIPSKAVDSTAVAPREADLAQVKDFLARDEVAKALSSQGLSPDQVTARLAQLSAEDLHSLALNVNQVQAAGNVPNYIWILLAVFLAVSILAIIF
jgi:PIN domain nuclease of toxin-antitoxin system